MECFFVPLPFLSSRILIILRRKSAARQRRIVSRFYIRPVFLIQTDAGDRKRLTESFEQRPVKSLGWLYILNSCLSMQHHRPASEWPERSDIKRDYLRSKYGTLPTKRSRVTSCIILNVCYPNKRK